MSSPKCLTSGWMFCRLVDSWMIISRAGMPWELHCLWEQSVEHQRWSFPSNILILIYRQTFTLLYFKCGMFSKFTPFLKLFCISYRPRFLYYHQCFFFFAFLVITIRHVADLDSWCMYLNCKAMRLVDLSGYFAQFGSWLLWRCSKSSLPYYLFKGYFPILNNVD